MATPFNLGRTLLECACDQCGDIPETGDVIYEAYDSDHNRVFLCEICAYDNDETLTGAIIRIVEPPQEVNS